MANNTIIEAYRGDAKTLVCFDLPKNAIKDLAGFSIHVKPGNKPGY
ncbi:MAG: hypothetical protein IPO90_10165 [Flavobacteriales bacterium]|nr:hypothetical protein [Flavobacteriales bacterium]